MTAGNAQNGSDRSGTYQLLAGLAGVIGTGIGGAAFLIFVGGTVFLARFRGAGISGPAALPLVDRADLLVVGADQLVAFLVAGAGVAFIACLSYVTGRRVSERVAWIERVVLLLVVVAGVVYLFAAPSFDGNPGWWLYVLALFVLAAGVLGDVAAQFKAGPASKPDTTFPEPLTVSRRRVLLVAGVLMGGAYYLWKAPPLDQYPYAWAFGAAVFVLLIGAILTDRLGWRALGGVGGGLWPASDRVSEREQTVALLLVAVVVFLGVSIYSVFANFARNVRHPLVSPSAVIIAEPGPTQLASGRGAAAARSGQSTSHAQRLRALWGLYVGQSQDYVYLAWTEQLPVVNPTKEPLRHARLIGLRRKDVIDIAISSVVAPRSAKVIAPTLCRQLVSRVVDARRLECTGQLQEGKSAK